ncbi:hypothetical protein AGDE_05379 [Angomonas deanei]|uniref:Mitochondrial carrier protein n=1 Tax=Angomonas deanei TaxID=59799 RepID=S9UP19_9TRYP|nr:hypothetical protein AGDE_09329 [Angomonas deanei]EPY37648.1 hypothetical protein AGDE_06286 [Angomonas deanei]EPY37921.1 hypothetical protein AGDE_06012 [Angomonas deanei]EPY38550.1 hypothetical protein AGDE_05379 [Angomonas deanei]CAD2218053.1 hypothetical protein, conserved [Angomonas deanei]|eukprot:EPY30663.1 hypothetical protein AGDE_09329 [Angomonas deanei]
MVFEVLSYAYATVFWVIGRVNKIENATLKSITDPGTFISGALAGAVGRMAALPFDKGGPKGIQQTILRRMPQMGCLMMFYCPVARKILPGTEKEPRTKLLATFLVASMAGFNMRFFTNPITRVLDESARSGKSPKEVAKIFKNKTILQFWYCSPNLLANALYFGTLLTVFEGLRRFSERNILPLRENTAEELQSEGIHLQADGAIVPVVDAAKPVPVSKSFFVEFNPQNYATQVAQNFVIGGVAATVASTICYPFSAHQYLQTVIHDSAICRGLIPTLLKEVPMMATFFATFSLIQPILAPRHGARCGFGY